MSGSLESNATDFRSRRHWTRLWVLTALLLASHSALAAYQLSIVPSQPVAGEPIFLHIEKVGMDYEPCITTTDPLGRTIAISGQDIEIRTQAEPGYVCEGLISLPTVIDFELGSLAPGNYRLTLIGDIVPSGPINFGSIDFRVQGLGSAPSPAAIPLWNKISMWWLMVATLLVAIWSIRQKGA